MVTWRKAVAFGCLLVAAPPAPAPAAEPGEARLAALTQATPPRTVNDITRVLGEYKPEPQKAAAAKAAADRQPAPGLTEGALAEFYHDRGAAAGEVGRLTQQLADMRQALAYAEKAGTDRSRILQLLMGAEALMGNFANAIRYAEERAEIDDRRGARGRLFAAYAALVRFNIRRGDLASAERWVERAKDAYGDVGVRQPNSGGGGRKGAPRQAAAPAGDSNRSLSQPSWRASVAGAEGELLIAQGRYRPAEASLRTAVEQSNEFLANVPKLPPGSDHPPMEFLQNGRNQMIGRLSEALAMQGKLVEAEVESRSALVNSLRVVGRFHTWTAQLLTRLTKIVAEQGRGSEAEQLARATMAIYDAIDASRSWGIASARQLLGDALVSQGRWTDAMAAYDAMMAGLQGDDAGTASFGFGELDWVTALIKTGHAEPAITMATRLLERRRQTFGEQHPRTALTRAYLGMALAAGGRREPALQAYRDAVPLLLSAGWGEETSARAQRLALLLDAYIRLLADIRGTPTEANAKLDAAAEAFRIADAARGQTVQKAVSAASARVTLRDPALADLARREQDTGQALAGLESTLVYALSAPADQQDAQSITVLRDQIAQLRQSRDGLRQEIVRRFPDYAELTNPKPASIAAARQTLRPGEAVLATYASTDAVFVWAVPQQGPIAFAKATMSAQQIAAAVKRLRRALDPQAQTTGEIPPFDVKLANQLYDGLLKPVEPGWKGAASLIVVTDGMLGQLPLGVLVTEPTAQPAEASGALLFAGYKPVPFLARQVAIAQLPSVATLPTLRALPAGDANRKAFVGFGDPLFNLQQTGVQLADAGALTTRGIKLKLRSAPKIEQADSAVLGMLPRLPDTADEMRSIARALNADPDKDVFVGAAANERTVKTMTLSDRRVIAFATHGLVPGDLNGLSQPALALSAPQPGGDGDGLLAMDEVLGLKLNADWVVLSACNTAAGDGAGAEAVSGLGRAFFYAGARALLVSNWPVETTSARALTTDLFRRQAADPQLSRADALRQAELALIDGDGALDPATRRVTFSYAHPIFWAPFSLVGDGGAH